MNNQTTNPVFHGSDIEKISACYHIKKEAIVCLLYTSGRIVGVRSTKQSVGIIVGGF